MATTKYRKPVAVKVEWSENDVLHNYEGRSLSFEDFEAIARSEARKRVGGGYDKTSVVVMFDDDSKCQFRIDIAENDTHGVRHHVEGYLRFLETERGKDYYEQSPAPSREFFDFLRTIKF